MSDEHEHQASRRRFLRYSGSLGAGGIAGCLGEGSSDGDETGIATHPAPRLTDPGQGEDSGPTWETTLFPTWRGRDPARAVTLQWLVGATTRPDPTVVRLRPEAGDSEAESETAIAALGTEEPGPYHDAEHVNVRKSGARGETIGLLRFEDVIGTAETQVPPDATVESATLIVETVNVGGGGTAHRMLEDWSETVTWSDFGTDGIELGEEASGPIGATGEFDTGPTEIDVTTAVRSWVAGEANHGIALFANTWQRWAFDSTASDAPPRLEVTHDGRTVTFQNGVDGYDGTVDTYVEGVRRPYGTLYRHRAEFTELEPDTRYEIEIDGRNTGDVVRTAPATLEEPITFAEGGDVGTDFQAKKLHEQAASWDPLFALVGGDIAYANARNENTWIQFLEDWNELMRSGDRLIPLVAAIGNHELPRGTALHGEVQEAPFYYALFDNVHRENAYWMLDIGDSVSIGVLDSDHTTPIAGEQTAWLDAALSERSDRDHLMVTSHVPAYPSANSIGIRDREDIRAHWVPLYEEHGVDVAFEHDDHAYKRTHKLRGGEPADDGVLYLGDGGWGRDTRDVKGPDERPYLAKSAATYNVNRVEIAPDGVRRFTAIDTDGETVDQFEMGTKQ